LDASAQTLRDRIILALQQDQAAQALLACIFHKIVAAIADRGGVGTATISDRGYSLEHDYETV